MKIKNHSKITAQYSQANRQAQLPQQTTTQRLTNTAQRHPQQATTAYHSNNTTTTTTQQPHLTARQQLTCAVRTCVLRAPHYAEVCRPASLQRIYVGYKARITQGKLHVKNDMSLVIVHMRKRGSDGFAANRNHVYRTTTSGAYHRHGSMNTVSEACQSL